MSQFSRTIRSSATGSGAAVVELIAPTTKGLSIREIGIAIVNATASTFALGRPAAIGITPTTPVALLNLAGVNPAGSGTLAVAWGTGPTIPGAFYRQCSLPATAGAERIWKFEDQPLVVPASGTIILWSLSTVSIADIYFTVDEGF